MALAVKAGESVKSVAQRFNVNVNSVHAACSRSGITVRQRSEIRETFEALLDRGVNPYEAAEICNYGPSSVATLVCRWKKRRGITGQLDWNNIPVQIDRA